MPQRPTREQPDVKSNALACPNVRRQLLSMLCTKTGDQLVNPKTTLAWVMGSMGAPAYLLGLLVPVRESLSMLPQFLLAGIVRSLSYRRPAWLVGAFVQMLAVGGMVVSAWQWSGATGGWLILGCLACFALGRALCSIAGKDMLGKTVPKAQRGRVNGWATTGAGLVTLGLGLFGAGFLNHQTTGGWLLLPLILAVFLWGAAMFIYAGIREKPGEKGEKRTSNAQAAHAWRLIITDQPFRRFLTARMLMTGSAFSAPYFVFISQSTTGQQLSGLGSFVAAGALASAMSGWVWGRMADGSSRRVLVGASGLAGLVSLAVWFTREMPSDGWFARLFYPTCFLVLHVAHNGVRVGRKTFLLNMAEGSQRTDYIAISNSLMGCFLIMTGLAVSLLSHYPPAWFVLGFGCMSLMGAVWALRLPHVETAT